MEPLSDKEMLQAQKVALEKLSLRVSELERLVRGLNYPTPGLERGRRTPAPYTPIWPAYRPEPYVPPTPPYTVTCQLAPNPQNSESY